MADSLRDLMRGYFETVLGHTGSVTVLEREWFILSLGSGFNSNSWNDAALAYYSAWNGTTYPTSLLDEAFKYYGGLSGLTPVGSYSLRDHMYKVFNDNGGPNLVAPITDNLEAHYDASLVDGYQVDNSVSKNLLTYNQATVETDTTGFFIGANCSSMVRSTSAAKSGSASIAITSTAAGNCVSYNCKPSTAYIPVVAGNTYTIMAHFLAAATGRTIGIGFDFYDSNKNYLSGSGSSTTTSNTSTWTRVTHSYTMAANVAYLDMYFYFTAVGAAEVHYVDEFSVHEGSSTDWIAPGKKHAKNLLTYNQATVETDTTGLSSSINCTVARSTLYAAQGVASLEITSILAGSAQGGTYSIVPNAQTVPASPSTLYTILVSASAPSITTSADTTVLWYTSAGSFISSAVATAKALSTSWQQWEITTTSPSNAAYMVLRLRWTAVGAGEKVYIDKLSMHEGYSTVWTPPYRGSAITDGSAVGFWRDLSGKERHAVQATAANQPLLRRSNRNLLTYNQATWETDTTGAGSPFNGTIARSTSQSLHGAASLALTVTVATVPTASLLAGLSATPVQQGITYTGVVSTYVAAAGRQVQVRFYWFKSDGTASATAFTLGSNIFLTSGVWEQSVVSDVPPSDAAYGQLRLVVTSGSIIGDVYYTDAWGMWEGSSTTWLSPVNLANSKPAVQFDGKTSRIGLSTDIGQSKKTVYMVETIPVNSPSGYTFGLISAGTVLLAGPGTSTASANHLAVWRDSTNTTLTSTRVNPVVGFDIPRVISYIFDDPMYCVVDGVKSTGTVTSSLVSPSEATIALWIGTRDSAGSGISACSIAALLIYSKAHTDAERQRIERWLGSIYGISVA